MTRAQSTYAERCEPATAFEYPDEPNGAPDTSERLQRLLGEFALDVVKFHEPKVALLKLSALQYLTNPEKNSLPVGKCAEALGVSRMTFHRLRVAVGISLRSLLCKRG